MIDLDQFVTLATMGTGLILVGLWPGLLQSCADGLHDVSNLLAVRLGGQARQRPEGPVEAYWFALAGVALNLVTILAYLSN